MISTSTSSWWSEAGNAAEHLLDRRLRIVGDDENQDALAAQVERWNGAHVSFLQAKNGPVARWTAGYAPFRLAGLLFAEHRIGRGEHRPVVVVAQVAQDASRILRSERRTNRSAAR